MVSLLDKWRFLQALVANPDVSPTAKIIAARLLDHSNGSTGRCNPSYQTLARGAGLTRRRAMKAVKELEWFGLISVLRTSRAEAKGRFSGLPSNNFTINWARGQHPLPSAENDTSLVPLVHPGGAPDSPSPRSAPDDHPNAETGTLNNVTRSLEVRTREMKSVREQGSRLPPDWQPSSTDLDFAMTEGLSPERASKEAKKFRDYWLSLPGPRGVKLDWAAVWRNWVRSAAEPGRGRPVLLAQDAAATRLLKGFAGFVEQEDQDE
jgi:hypothetical protein